MNGRPAPSITWPDSQAQLIGGLLLAPGRTADVLARVTGIARPEHFTNPQLAEIYRTLEEVAREFPDSDSIDRIRRSGAVEVARRLASTAVPASAVCHATCIRKDAQRREVKALVDEFRGELQNHFWDTSELVSAFQGRLRDLCAESEPKPPRFRLLTLDELLAAPDPGWTAHEIIPQRGVGVIYGASTSGKTFVGLDLACAVVRGVDWHGRSVARGSVLYVATEGRLALRLAAYMDHHGLPPHALDRLRILESRINLLTGDAAGLIEAIKHAELPDLRLVIVDTLNRAMPGGNENASEDMGRMVDSAAAISEATSSTCIFIHHSGKDASQGARGHSSLKAATEFELSVRRDGDARAIDVEKVRDAEDGYTLTGFELVPVGDSVVLCATDAPKNRPKQARLTPGERIALDALHEALSDAGTRRVATAGLLDHGAKVGQYVALLDDWRTHVYSRLGADTPADNRRKTFLRARERLIAGHRVHVHEDYVWLP